MIIDLLEKRQQMTSPQYAPRRLTPRTDTMPPCVALELQSQYIAVFKGPQGWIGQDSNGYIFNVTVIQTGLKQYSCESTLAEPLRKQG